MFQVSEISPDVFLWKRGGPISAKEAPHQVLVFFGMAGTVEDRLAYVPAIFRDLPVKDLRFISLCEWRRKAEWQDEMRTAPFFGVVCPLRPIKLLD